MLYVKEDAFEIEAGKKVLKAEEYAVYLKGQEIIDKAQERADQIVEEAKQAFEDEKKRGYELGLEEGNMKMSELMIESAAKSLKNFEEFENDVIDVVIKAVRKVLGEIDEKELIGRVVRNALETVRNQKKVNIMISPSQEPIIREQLNSILAQFPTINFIEVTKDSRIEEGGCIIETDMGVVDATIELQIKAIKSALTRVIK